MICSMPRMMTCLHKTLQFLRVGIAPVHDHVGLINDQDWIAITFLPVEKEGSATNEVWAQWVEGSKETHSNASKTSLKLLGVWLCPLINDLKTWRRSIDGSVAEPIFCVSFNCDWNAAQIDDPIFLAISGRFSSGVLETNSLTRVSMKLDGLLGSFPLQSIKTAFFLVSYRRNRRVYLTEEFYQLNLPSPIWSVWICHSFEDLGSWYTKEGDRADGDGE